MHPLDAVRKRLTRRRTRHDRPDAEKHPSPADRAAEKTIAEAQREAENEVDPKEPARIERAQREAEEEIDPAEQAHIERAQREAASTLP